MPKPEVLRVLIVEDDEAVRSITEKFLHKMPDIEVVCIANNVAEAKKCVPVCTIDLMLIDIYLPDGNGIELLKWIRAQDINVDAIMLTADRRGLSLESARRYGAWDYILKPFKYERFKEAIDHFRRQRQILDNEADFQQHMVDQVMHHKQGQIEWKNQSYKKILAFLKENSARKYSASELSEILGLSRITARKYLEAMEIEGVITLELSYGNVGRPTNTYRYGNQ